jgi:chloramphenicol O-acetyltransferase
LVYLIQSKPILCIVRYLKQVQDKINWLWINFKDKIFFEIWEQQLNFQDFIKETSYELENYKQEKTENIINDVLSTSNISFNYFDSVSNSEVVDYKDIFKKFIK